MILLKYSLKLSLFTNFNLEVYIYAIIELLLSNYEKLKLFLITLFVFNVTGCQTIKEKTDAIVEKENEKLSKYIRKPASDLQMDLGKPDEDFKNAKGNLNLVYNTKKYGIPCERRFEINPKIL